MNVPAKLPGETNREYAFRTISDNIISLNIEPGSMIETGSSAANQVCEIAERDGYDQIVMGTKGKSNMERFLVGSVSNRILLHAPCTCTLVR